MAYIEYVEVNVYGMQIQILVGNKFTLNGIGYTAPYSGPNGLTINIIGGKLVLSTTFGLTVTWDGVSDAVYTISADYNKYVCGLCGNADGKILSIKCKT